MRHDVRHYAIAFTAIVVGMTIIGLASGLAIAQTSETISACANNRTGALRLAAAPAECTAREASISWNQAGPTGATGPPGAEGPPGVVGVNRRTDVSAVAPGTSGVVSAFCQFGEMLVGGGFVWRPVGDPEGFTVSPGLIVSDSFPTPSSTWQVAGWNETPSTFNLEAIALCLETS